MLGTRGVPAHYGGFETCVEEVGARLAARGHDVVVYCRSTAPKAQRPKRHRGMRLVYLPAIRRRSLETLSHSAISVAHLMLHGADVAFFYNSANAAFLPLARLRRIPVATHVDGLEWKRAKWSGAGRRYYRVAEQLAVRWSDALIADAQGIADYYTAQFAAPTVGIAYGTATPTPEAVHRISELGLEPGGYHLVVARFEPENHVDTIVDGYVRSGCALPLVVVGSAPYGREYTDRVRRLADGRVRMLGGIWDNELLDGLYAGALTYLHGHSVGGTNPSLLRAMGASTAVIAWDVNFNEEVLGDAGLYFSRPDELARLLEAAESDPEAEALRGLRGAEEAKRYDWNDVAERYEALAKELPARRAAGRRMSGRRLEAAPR